MPRRCSRALPEVDGAAQRRLDARLAAEAADAGIVDVAYRTLDTPVGTLLLAATGQGLMRVAYPRADHDRVLEQPAPAGGALPPRGPQRRADRRLPGGPEAKKTLLALEAAAA